MERCRPSHPEYSRRPWLSLRMACAGGRGGQLEASFTDRLSLPHPRSWAGRVRSVCTARGVLRHRHIAGGVHPSRSQSRKWKAASEFSIRGESS